MDFSIFHQLQWCVSVWLVIFCASTDRVVIIWSGGRVINHCPVCSVRRPRRGPRGNNCFVWWSISLNIYLSPHITHIATETHHHEFMPGLHPIILTCHNVPYNHIQLPTSLYLDPPLFTLDFRVSNKYEGMGGSHMLWLCTGKCKH